MHQGGGYAGVHAINDIQQSSILGSKYRIVLINASDHFFHIMAVLRAAVDSGVHDAVFVPYTSLMRKSDEFIHGTANKITNSKVTVALHAGGETVVEYKYLIIATGSHHPTWANIEANNKWDGVKTLKERQAAIKRASRIVIVGGGITGMELAGEIADYFPDKHVTIIHSSNVLGNQDMPDKAREVVDDAVKRLNNVDIIYNDTIAHAQDVEGDLHIVTKTGRLIDADLQIVTFGLSPNSSIMNSLDPSLINPKTSAIKVKPTFQLDSPKYPNIFVIGDVADAPGAKMAMNTDTHANILVKNITSLETGNQPTAVYKGPMGAFAITLGRDTKNLWREQAYCTETCLKYNVMLPEKGSSGLGYMMNLDMAIDISEQPISPKTKPSLAERFVQLMGLPTKHTHTVDGDDQPPKAHKTVSKYSHTTTITKTDFSDWFPARSSHSVEEATMHMVPSKLPQIDLTANAWAQELLTRLQSRKGAMYGVLGAVVIYKLWSILLSTPGQFKAISRVKEFSLILTGVSGPERRRKEAIPLLARGEPAYFSSERGPYTLYIAEPKMARTLLMRTGTFPHGELGAFPKGSMFDKMLGTPNIVSSNGQIWKTHRKIASPVFRKSMPLQLFGNATLELFEEYKKADYKVDSSDYMERFTLDVIGRAAFDYDFGAIRYAENDGVKAYKNVFATVFDPVNLATSKFDLLLYRISKRRRQAHADLDTFLSTIDDVIAKKRATLSSERARSDEEDAEKDLLTMILEANSDEGDQGQRMTDEEVKSNIFAFFVAGHDTTSNESYRARAEAIAIMGDEPRDIVPTNEHLQQLQYINQIIQEILRLEPQLWLQPVVTR
ncbi:hypothetical protein BZG36_03384 [Bifiguratus adelaidae]|uniref:FAD/NAD(P)-binding domain-containing protein n=1 Tax=Bifiguratus adelaidae TaxID=1938954 RepID=A0A261Y0G5_9FUNG|nr:hypothetical protein BZG36_03384 [Bifiguratus adelaidae]